VTPVRTPAQNDTNTKIEQSQNNETGQPPNSMGVAPTVGEIKTGHQQNSETGRPQNNEAGQPPINEIGQLQNNMTATATVGDIVGAYKSVVFNGCLEIFKTKNETMGKLLQRNYHEHIIRNEKSYHNISEYIINNPAKWPEDKFYSK
ncbi:MAG: hypothetical protein H0X62_06740, partial [Bacteroidetes bacterium]|nr:hypothetical protein [Bacteroidota bacterium]